MTTVTAAPLFTQRRVCSKVRVAGALVSGGKLSVRKRIRIACSTLPINLKAHEISAAKYNRQARSPVSPAEFWTERARLQPRDPTPDFPWKASTSDSDVTRSARGSYRAGNGRMEMESSYRRLILPGDSVFDNERCIGDLPSAVMYGFTSQPTVSVVCAGSANETRLLLDI